MGKGDKNKQVDWVDRVEIILGLGLRKQQVLTEKEQLDLKFFQDYPDEDDLDAKTLGVKRGVGTGSFGKVLSKAKLIHTGAQKILDEKDKKKKSRDLKGKNEIDFMIERFDDLLIQASKWRSKFDKSGRRIDEKKGGVLASSDINEIRAKKLKICDDLLEKATVTGNLLRKIRNEDLQSQRDVLEKSQQETAINLLKANGKSTAQGGSSQVTLIKGFTGENAFAFKPVKEESGTGIAKGGNCVREVVSSVALQKIKQQTGLDFGFPNTTFATIENEPGVLVEGIKGDFVNLENPPSGIDNIDFANKRRIHLAKAKTIIERVSGEQVQKVLLGCLAIGQFDMKWDNVAVEKDGTTRPYDNGAAFPTKTIMLDTIWKNDNKLFGDTFCYDLTNDNAPLMPYANDPIDQEMVESFLRINPDEIEQSVKQERDRISNQHGVQNVLSDDEISFGLCSVKAAQNVLRRERDQPLSLIQFLREYTAELRECFPRYELWVTNTGAIPLKLECQRQTVELAANQKGILRFVGGKQLKITALGQNVPPPHIVNLNEPNRGYHLTVFVDANVQLEGNNFSFAVVKETPSYKATRPN